MTLFIAIDVEMTLCQELYVGIKFRMRRNNEHYKKRRGPRRKSTVVAEINVSVDDRLKEEVKRIWIAYVKACKMLGRINALRCPYTEVPKGTTKKCERRNHQCSCGQSSECGQEYFLKEE